jgi:hypothetical protein
VRLQDTDDRLVKHAIAEGCRLDGSYLRVVDREAHKRSRSVLSRDKLSSQMHKLAFEVEGEPIDRDTVSFAPACTQVGLVEVLERGNRLEDVTDAFHRLPFSSDRRHPPSMRPEASLLRLVSAILVEISEDWETGRRYLAKEDD